MNDRTTFRTVEDAQRHAREQQARPTLAEHVFAFFAAVRRNPSVLDAIRQRPPVATAADALLQAAGEAGDHSDEDRAAARRFACRSAASDRRRFARRLGAAYAQDHAGAWFTFNAQRGWLPLPHTFPGRGVLSYLHDEARRRLALRRPCVHFMAEMDPAERAEFLAQRRADRLPLPLP